MDLDNVAGTWTGYDSPYRWPEGNVQGQLPGSPKSWAQVAAEGARAYPTQSRVMYKASAASGCSRFGMTDSFVPFQPNVNPDGSANAASGQDHAILYGAVVKDPGGLPTGTTEYLTFSRFYNAPGAPFTATLHLRSGSGTLDAGDATIKVPSGWSATPTSQSVGPVGPNGETTVSFSVTPDPSATVNQNYRISTTYTTGSKSGYTDDVVRVVSPAEGRFQRFGKWAEYDSWLEDTAPAARRINRSSAIQSMGVGETITVPVDVHNWSTSAQSGTVSISLPTGMSAPSTSESYGPLAPGGDTTVEFEVSNSYTNATLPGASSGPNSQSTTVDIPITTTYSTPSGSGSETLQMSIVPKTAIPAAASAPTVDGQEDAGEYSGEPLDVGRKWEPGGSNRNCSPQGVDCGSSSAPGTADSTYAKVTRSGDDLYFFVHVKDDFQSYAVTPAECVGHWQADSVELLIDPRGNASQRNRDTASTFKLAVFPFTNDPSNTNGNGVNGPCWSRDADNHQGFSTGPLAATIDDAPNAPGVEVATDATWVGSNDTAVDHSYAGGGYTIEVKIPMADLPAAVDPDRMGLNITPYDNDDNTAGTGSTVLRHTDQSTRLAWSTFGSVQSDPYRWGHATLPGYTPPAGRSTEAPDPNVSNPNLNGALSPETIAQSARDGVPISGRVPAPPNGRITAAKSRLEADSVELDLTANGQGRAQVFVWSGNTGYIPVFKTSCDPAGDPPPDYGLSACSEADGDVPPWSPDMSGRVLAERHDIQLGNGVTHVSLPLDAGERDKLAADGRVLVAFETPQDEVQALDVALDGPAGPTPGNPGNGGTPGTPGAPGTPADVRCGNTILGTAAANRLIGTALGDLMSGFAGNDRMDGRAGDDCLNGMRGNDRLYGGTGVDTLEGGPGNDREWGQGGRDTIRGGSGRDTLSGGPGGDGIRGNTGDDRISGGSGNDRISGGSGRDRITPGPGRDSVEAGSGADRIYAKDGKADSIDCGRGRDTVVTRDRADRLTSCEVVGKR